MVETTYIISNNEELLFITKKEYYMRTMYKLVSQSTVTRLRPYF